MLTTRYINPDNESSINIFQERNLGAMSFSIQLKIDPLKYVDGKGFLNSLIIDEIPVENLFDENTLPYISSLISFL